MQLRAAKGVDAREEAEALFQSGIFYRMKSSRRSVMLMK
jgi:hypothetical protein